VGVMSLSECGQVANTILAVAAAAALGLGGDASPGGFVAVAVGVTSVCAGDEC